MVHGFKQLLSRRIQATLADWADSDEPDNDIPLSMTAWGVVMRSGGAQKPHVQLPTLTGSMDHSSLPRRHKPRAPRKDTVTSNTLGTALTERFVGAEPFNAQ